MVRTPNPVLKARREEREAEKALVFQGSPFGNIQMEGLNEKLKKDYKEKKEKRIQIEKLYGINKKKIKSVS